MSQNVRIVFENRLFYCQEIEIKYNHFIELKESLFSITKNFTNLFLFPTIIMFSKSFKMPSTEGSPYPTYHLIFLKVIDPLTKPIIFLFLNFRHKVAKIISFYQSRISLPIQKLAEERRGLFNLHCTYLLEKQNIVLRKHNQHIQEMLNSLILLFPFLHSFDFEKKFR